MLLARYELILQALQILKSKNTILFDGSPIHGQILIYSAETEHHRGFRIGDQTLSFVLHFTQRCQYNIVVM